MRSLIYTPHQTLCRLSNPEGWDGRAHSTYRGEKRCIQGFGGETWGQVTTWKTQA